jgi:hypothetical protein
LEAKEGGAMIRAMTKQRGVLPVGGVAGATGDNEPIDAIDGNAHSATDRQRPAHGLLDAEQIIDLHSFDLDSIDLPSVLIPRVTAGLFLLWNSVKLAKGFAEDPWQFSVEWPELQRAGLTCNEGRWLIHGGLVLQALEVTSATDVRRKFEPYASLSLSEKTCLLPTEKGCRLFRRMAEARGAPAADAGGTPTALAGWEFAAGKPGQGDDAGREAQELLKPIWDRDRRQLRLGPRVVKEFKVPAANQEIILAVFQEEDWPAKIDDPLPRSPAIDPQRRLHDTINSLNRNQRQRLVHFGADGLGRGVRWRLDEAISP